MPVRAQGAMHHQLNKAAARPPAAEENKQEAPKLKMLDKLKEAGDKIITSNRVVVNVDSKEDKDLKNKRERADLIVYALFMFFFTLNTIDGLGNAAGYTYTNQVASTINLPAWETIVTTTQFSSWLETSFIDGIFSTNFEASGTMDGPLDLETDNSAPSGWLIQGPVRIAQLRSNTFKCKTDMPSPLKNYPFKCTKSREMSYFESYFHEEYEDKNDFSIFEYENENCPTVKYQREKQTYSTYDTPESLHRYPAPGFAILIDSHDAKAKAIAQVNNITKFNYLDRQTNVIFIDMSVYNYMLDMTQWIRLTAEFSSSGGIECSYEIIPVQLYWTDSVYARKVTLNVFVAIGYLYFLSNLIFKIKTEGFIICCGKLLFWTQLINIGFYFIQLCFRYQSHSLVQHGFMSSYGIGQIDFLSNKFLDFRAPVKAMRFALTFQSINTFLNWFKLVGYLASYPVFALMTKTISFAMDELTAFSVVFIIIMFGFAQAHCMFFGNQLYNYRTITISFYTLFRAMLGDFDFNETYHLHFIIGPLFFFMFVGIAFLVVLNIIIAIIADAYVEANEQRKIDMKKKKLAEEALRQDMLAKGVDPKDMFNNGISNIKNVGYHGAKKISQVVPSKQLIDAANIASSGAKNAYSYSGGQKVVNTLKSFETQLTRGQSQKENSNVGNNNQNNHQASPQDQGPSPQNQALVMENIEDSHSPHPFHSSRSHDYSAVSPSLHSPSYNHNNNGGVGQSQSHQSNGNGSISNETKNNDIPLINIGLSSVLNEVYNQPKSSSPSSSSQQQQQTAASEAPPPISQDESFAEL